MLSRSHVPEVERNPMAMPETGNGAMGISTQAGRDSVPSKGFMCLEGSPGLGSPWVPLSTACTSACALKCSPNPSQ